jgi:predicted NBD/HSP70 family sugar kinase
LVNSRNIKNILTIDLGGTYTRLALFEDNLIKELIKYETPKTPNEFINKFTNETKIFNLENISGIGVGAAGYWDQGKILRQSINLPQYIAYPLWQEISEITKLKISLGTDVELAAMGEAVHGLKNQFSNVLYINMGTGFSAGLYKDAMIYTTPYSPALRLSYTTTAQSLKDTLINLACLFSPQIIVIGGSKALENWNTEIEPVINEAMAYLSKILVYPLKIQASTLEYPTLWGALELVQQKH